MHRRPRRSIRRPSLTMVSCSALENRRAPSPKRRAACRRATRSAARRTASCRACGRPNTRGRRCGRIANRDSLGLRPGPSGRSAESRGCRRCMPRLRGLQRPAPPVSWLRSQKLLCRKRFGSSVGHRTSVPVARPPRRIRNEPRPRKVRSGPQAPVGARPPWTLGRNASRGGASVTLWSGGLSASRRYRPRFARCRRVRRRRTAPLRCRHRRTT